MNWSASFCIICVTLAGNEIDPTPVPFVPASVPVLSIIVFNVTAVVVTATAVALPKLKLVAVLTVSLSIISKLTKLKHD